MFKHTNNIMNIYSLTYLKLSLKIKSKTSLERLIAWTNQFKNLKIENYGYLPKEIVKEL
jgi:hypothetical protein